MTIFSHKHASHCVTAGDVIVTAGDVILTAGDVIVTVPVMSL
jgi:ATP-dependent protease HslVU (ClpYQ) peptidase subunit